MGPPVSLNFRLTSSISSEVTADSLQFVCDRFVTREVSSDGWVVEDPVSVVMELSVFGDPVTIGI